MFAFFFFFLKKGHTKNQSGQPLLGYEHFENDGIMMNDPNDQYRGNVNFFSNKLIFKNYT